MSSFEEDVEVMMLWACWRKLKKKTKKERKMWVRDIFRKRQEKSQYYNLLQEMRTNDREFYFR